MYKLIVKFMVRRNLRRVRKDQYEPIVKRFGPSSRFRLYGDHELGGERRGLEEVRAFFRRTFELFPDLHLIPIAVVVNGWPWNTVVATRFRAEASLPDGGRYLNEGMQFLRLRWGRVAEDSLFEDTQKIVEAIQRIHAHAPVVA
jgi:ketosteroid isomerase-like protein